MIFTISELWFRIRTHDHLFLKKDRDSKVLCESFYLFENPEQMKSHPAYLEYEFANKIFFDELQASQKSLFVKPVENRNIVGPNINIVSGERNTKRNNLGEKDCRVDEHWTVLGGSTVLCLEVPDSMTWPSRLQEIVDKLSDKRIQVHNFGQAGFKAVKVESLFHLFLSRYTAVTRVIVFFGVNDAGWIAGSRPSNRLTYLVDGVLDLLSVVSKLVAFVSLKMRSRRVCKASKIYAAKTIRKFLEYKGYFEAMGVEINFILQPNVFCKTNPSNLELDLIESAEPLRIAGLHAAYVTYLSQSDGLITSAIDTFSDIDDSIFLDWCHIGVKGNSIIAKKVWDLLNNHLGSNDKTFETLNLMKNYKEIALSSRKIFKNKNELVYNYPLY